jgi:hypothetical protein
LAVSFLPEQRQRGNHALSRIRLGSLARSHQKNFIARSKAIVDVGIAD